MKKIVLTSLVLLMFISIKAQVNQKIEAKIDSIGNVRFSIFTKMNASEWNVWNANYGNNPAVIKREIERGMPSYFLDNFKLDKNDMERSFTLKFDGYGACTIDKRGRWKVKTDQKNANVTKLTDYRYMLIMNPSVGGQMLQYYIEFPKAAKNIKVDKDSFGESYFSFEMEDQTGKGIGYIAIIGIALTLLGILWLLIAMKKIKVENFLKKQKKNEKK